MSDRTDRTSVDVAVPEITDRSKRFPTETFRYLIAQPWRFPEYNGMPSGGVVELANGAVKKVY
ncbi:Uncharacterised protein [Mycolicibacterium phlei]|nr:hypothetical protein GR01_01135 [Mycobacteroides chelonae]ANB00773.1 hypothetical protein BB28_01175 [Mycobacteroides chelonae CCUG 47445]OLT81370.1 hypothetical protein BKG56_03815 [Mycobacteroides chelonae]ORV17404.1 hypothetical protein AWB96_04100 [Mycobacteroides chelonae]VEG14382.1 Uncharacterised protein [Mycolicibacterium phlei]